MKSALKEWSIFLARRLGYMIVVLFGVSLVTFFVTRTIGSPVFLIVGLEATEEMIQRATERLGLDRPIWEQYFIYVSNILQGDLGVSRFTHNPVLLDIQARLPATIELTMLAVLFAIIWAVPAGLIAGAKRGGIFDKFAQWIAQIGVSVPNFWLGLLLVFILYYLAGLFPAPMGRLPMGVSPPDPITGLYLIDSLITGNLETFWQALRQVFLPSFTLAFTASPAILQLTRNTMIGILNSDYIKAARSFGFTERIVFFKYALKNAIAPVATLIAMTFGWLIGGAVLVEVVFSWPGIGRYAVDAMHHSDYEPVVGVVLLCAFVYVLVYLITDIFHFIVDPRVKDEQGK